MLIKWLGGWLCCWCFGFVVGLGLWFFCYLAWLGRIGLCFLGYGDWLKWCWGCRYLVFGGCDILLVDYCVVCVLVSGVGIGVLCGWCVG